MCVCVFFNRSLPDQTPQLSWLDLTWEAGLDHQTAGHTEDGLDITWYSELHTRARLQSALATMSTSFAL